MDIENFAIKLPVIDLEKLNQTFYHNDAIEIINKESREMIRQLELAREEGIDEGLRRHSELVAAINMASQNGAHITIGDNVNGIQIQQNTVNSSQSMVNSKGLDYDEILKVLKEIVEFTEYPKFRTDFKDKADNMKALIENTITEVEVKGDEGLIKKSLKIVYDLSMGVSGSLIASGITALIAPVLFG